MVILIWWFGESPKDHHIKCITFIVSHVVRTFIVRHHLKYKYYCMVIAAYHIKTPNTGALWYIYTKEHIINGVQCQF